MARSVTPFPAFGLTLLTAAAKDVTMSHPPDHTVRSRRRGPIAYVDNSRGAYPWMHQIVPDPGYVSRFTLRLEKVFAIASCYRCLQNLTKRDHATGRIACKIRRPFRARCGATRPVNSAAPTGNRRRGDERACRRPLDELPHFQQPTTRRVPAQKWESGPVTDARAAASG
jgi:hypothetical protein